MNSDIQAKIEVFFETYRLRSYPKGQILILDGENPGVVYYLVSGNVKQYTHNYRGDEIILNVFHPPAFFPMSLAINQNDNPYVYEAETDIKVRQAPATEVVKFVQENPDVAFNLLSRVYRGTDGLLARMTHLMTSTAKARLMFEILIECRRFGKERPDHSYRLEINEKQLAARAGLTRETISREMAKLQKEGLVRVEERHIVVHNLDTLQDKLGSVV